MGFQRLASLWAVTLRNLALVRLRPFDGSTPEGRSKERYRRITLTAFSSAGARSLSVLISFVSIPLTIGYLGDERYGLWITISSLVTMLAFADLGLGNGLLNAIAEAHGRDDREAAQRAVSSAFFLLVAIALLLAVLFWLVSPYLPWQRLLNLRSPLAIQEAGPTARVLVTCFALNLPLGVVARIQLGYQEGFAANAWQIVGSLGGLAGLLVVIYLRAGLPWLVAALVGAPVLAALANGLHLFLVRRPWLRPRPRHVVWATAQRLLRAGALFLALQVAIAVAFQSDNVVIARVLGSAAVPQYAVPARLFSMITLFASFALTPLWPAYGEALARGDVPWVQRTLRRSLRVAALISVPSALLLAVIGQPFVRWWTGGIVAPTLPVLGGLALWSILATLGNSVAVLLNGANAIRFQVVIAVAMATANLLLSVYLARLIGVAGPVWGSVVAYSLFTLLPIALYVPRLLRGLGQPPP